MIRKFISSPGRFLVDASVGRGGEKTVMVVGESALVLDGARRL